MTAPKRHPLLIPKGDFCYKYEKSEEKYEVMMNSSDFGKSAYRKANTILAGEIVVVCPYWEKTDNGTVICHKLEYEVMGWHAIDRELAVQRLGEDAAYKLPSMSNLGDMLKICDLRKN